MASHDVIIVGGGIWGLTSALACAKRGMSVVVYDAERIGDGASGGVVGALAPHVPDQWDALRQFQFEALDSAESYWTSVDKKSGLSSGYGRIGRLIPIMDQRLFQLALDRVETAKKYWQGTYHWHVLDSHTMIPKQAAPFGINHETLAARVFPALALESLTQACKESGVRIFEHHPVEHIIEGRVFGEWGSAAADAIILAAGIDGFRLLSSFTGNLLGKGVKGQAAVLDVDLGDTPQIYADGIYIIPQENGQTSVGSTSENKWDNAFSVDGKLEDVIDRATKICPALEGAKISQRWANLRPKAKRRTPMLGPIPGAKGVFVALGPFKIGFGIAHTVGDILAECVSGSPIDLPLNFTVTHHRQNS